MEALEFEGNGLANDIPTFIAVMKRRDPALGEILQRHVSILQDLKTDDDRKRARAAYNNAVKMELLAKVEES